MRELEMLSESIEFVKRIVDLEISYQMKSISANDLESGIEDVYAPKAITRPVFGALGIVSTRPNQPKQTYVKPEIKATQFLVFIFIFFQDLTGVTGSVQKTQGI